MGLVSLTIALPLVGALALALVGDDDRTLKLTALGASLVTFIASVAMAVQFDSADPGFQLVDRADWIPSIGASFAVGIDGTALVLIVMTTFLTPLVILASWHMSDRIRGYLAAFLALEAAVIGVFAAMDLLLFYVFFEFSLVPMYLIIGIWGGVNRRYAAVKFFLYTLLGGLLMLVAILVVATRAGSFDYLVILDALRSDPLARGTQQLTFLAFFVAFAVKVPLFPVHTWLPDAHTEAPTAGSVILAAVLLKLGTFGLLRYSLPLFPDASRSFAFGTSDGAAWERVPWIMILAVVGVIYGAVVALMQRDIKRLIAYSSVSHMGFVVLGIFALDLTAGSASVVQMVNHGLSTGALFLLVGFLYDRRHTRQIAAFGGLARRVPLMAGLWLVVSLSSLALPGLNGFVGEFPILLGTFQSSRWAAAIAAFGAVLAALYLLWAYQRMFHGPLEGADNEHTTDLDRRELWVLAPIVVLIVAIGVFPRPLFDAVEPSVARVLEGVGTVDVAGDDPSPIAPAVPAQAPAPATDTTAGAPAPSRR